MNIFLEILNYAGILLFILWASLVLKDLLTPDYTPDVRQSTKLAVHNTIFSLYRKFPGYVIPAMIPASLLILSAVLGSLYEMPPAQIKTQIILLAVIFATVGIIWNVVMHLYASIHTKKLSAFLVLTLDSVIVAVPLVLLVRALPEARLSKAFLFSLPVVVISSFLAKAAYALIDYSD